MATLTMDTSGGMRYAFIDPASNDTTGTVYLTTGPAPQGGPMAVVTFGAPYGSPPSKVSITDDTEATGIYTSVDAIVSNITTTGFTITARSTPGVVQTYRLPYTVTP